MNTVKGVILASESIIERVVNPDLKLIRAKIKELASRTLNGPQSRPDPNDTSELKFYV